MLKHYLHSLFPWIHRWCGEGGLAAWTTACLPCTLLGLYSSTGEDTPALLHHLMQTEGCQQRHQRNPQPPTVEICKTKSNQNRRFVTQMFGKKEYDTILSILIDLKQLALKPMQPDFWGKSVGDITIKTKQFRSPSGI